MTLPVDPSGNGRAVTVTGTRSIDGLSAADLDSVFDSYLRPFADPTAHFYVGGAAGIDTAALGWLARHTSAAITIAVPCSVSDQPADAIEAISAWLAQGRITDVAELGAKRLGTAAYHARNRWMVDRSTFVIGFPRGTNPMSGTWYTLNYAAELGKPRLVVPM